MLKPILILLTLASLHAQEKPDEPSRQELINEATNLKDGNQDTYRNRYENEGMEKVIIKFPEVGTIYQKCKEDNKSTPEKIANCTWDEVKLDSEKAKAIRAFLSSDGEDNSPSTEKTEQTNIESADITNFKKQKTKAQIELEAYLKNRMEEVLFGLKTGGPRVTHDHTTYYDLYKTQLGKNLINGLSSYCLESKKDTAEKINGETYYVFKTPDKDKIVQVRNDNLNKLSSEAMINDDGKQVSTNEGYAHFAECIRSLAFNCENKNNPQACQTMKYVKGIKIALKEVDNIDKQWEEKSKQSQATGFAYTENSPPGRVNIDKIVNISSNEVMNESGLSKIAEEEKKVLEECEKNYQSNKELCDKYLMDEDEGNEILTEYEIRQIALEDELNEKIGYNKDDPNDSSSLNIEGLKSYLKELGYEDSKIEEILADETKAKSVLKSIGTRYKNERTAVIDAMRKKIESKTINQETVKTNPKEAQDKFVEIKDDYSSMTDKLQAVIHYSNIVSGFLEVTAADGVTKGSNSKALEAELENSAYAPDNRMPASDGTAPTQPIVSANHLELIKNMAPAKNSDDFEDGDSSTIDEETIEDKIFLIDNEF